MQKSFYLLGIGGVSMSALAVMLKEKGFQVKKGSVSYMVWATPRTIKVKQKEDPNAEPKDINDFFAVCHLFDVSQVVRIENQQN